MLVVCEGKVTEPAYLLSWMQDNRNRLVSIVVVPDRGVPKSVVEYAVRMKKEAQRESRKFRDPYLKYDEVWCVFDVDIHPNLLEALQQARDNGIEVALSNPCFELWILIHFQDQFAYEDRSVIQKLCRNHLPEFNKLANFEALRNGYDDAVRRAIQLEKRQVERGTPQGNPSTSVYKLTERIRELGKENFLLQMIPPPH